MEVNEGATTLVYRIDDRTGPWVKVQRWITEDQDPSNQQERTVCQEGMYVKVIGHIKTFNKQMNVTAFHIKPISDYNEITHHLAEVIFIHLATTRGVPVVSQTRTIIRIIIIIMMITRAVAPHLGKAAYDMFHKEIYTLMFFYVL